MPVEMLKKLPERARRIWESAYETARKKYSEERSARIAWAAVKKRFKKVEGRWVGKTVDSEKTVSVYYEFAGEFMVQKDKDGNLFVDAVLSGTDPDEVGDGFSEEALKSYAEQINERGIKGRIDDHKLFDSLKKQGYTPDQIQQLLSEDDSPIEAVKAWFKDGKLYIRNLIKKGFEKVVNTFKGLSLEARVPKNLATPNGKGLTYRGGEVIGYTLTNKPAYLGATFL